MMILVAGDFCLTKSVPIKHVIDNADYLWGELMSDIKSADYAIVNFEAPIVTSYSAKPIDKIGPNLSHSPIAIDLIRRGGFKCVTLANNHFRDFGDDGVRDTLIGLKANEIDTVGGGVNLSEASKTLYKDIKGKKLAIINCCENEYSIATEKSGGSNPINPIAIYYQIKEAKNNADFVLVITHGGHEGYNLPSPRMQQLYRYFIDVGANAVVNHHQHCFSGMEKYNGGLIFYGLGNFYFNPRHPKKTPNKLWHTGYMVMLNFDSGVMDYSLIPYKQCYDSDLQVKLDNSQEFIAEFNKLSDIIADPKLITEHFDKYVSEQKRNILGWFTHYTNRYTLALYRRGMLPPLLSKAMKRQMQNAVRCESHRDILIHSLDL